jgi:DNA primase
MRDHFWQIRQAARASGKRSNDYRTRAGTGQFPASGDQGQVELKGGAPAKLRGLGAVVRAVDTPELLDFGAETLALAAFPDEDVGRIRDALLDFAHAGNPIDRGTLCAHLADAGNMRAASLLNEYPVTPPIAVDGPEAREWLIALEQYMVAGRSAEQDTHVGMDDAGGDATSSPSAWRRKHQLVAERRALRARMNEAAGKVGES